MYLWLGQSVDQATIQNLFGVSGVQLNVEKVREPNVSKPEQVHSTDHWSSRSFQCKLLDIDTPISKNVRSLIKYIQEQRKASMKVSDHCCLTSR